jgi:GNAT superfamily N-acetyltransferase
MSTREPESVAEVGPLNIRGLNLSGELYEGDPTPDGYGVKKIVAFRNKRKIVKPEPDNEARLSYIEFDNHTALFLGMLVKRTMRGQNLGRHLFEYFLEHIQEEGLSFAGTGKIHKPLIALTLEREGLRPKSRDHMVEVLPPPYSTKDGVPRVRMLKSNPDDQRVVDHSPLGTPFYVVARPSSYRGLDVDPRRIVGIHTGYNLTGEEQPMSPIPPVPAIPRAA